MSGDVRERQRGLNSLGDVRIEKYSSASPAAWNAAAAALGASFYHLYEWRSVNETALGHDTIYLAALCDSEIVGMLPLIWIRSHVFGRILCSMPFVNYGGPVALTPAIECKLIDAAKDCADGWDADYLELRCMRALESDLPASTHKVSMTMALTPDPQTLWDGFTHKHRKNVKRAYKNDLTVTSGGAELLEPFYRMLQESWRNLGTPLYSKRYFRVLLDQLGHRTRLFVCHRRGAPVCAALTGYHRGVCEGLWAGGGALARELDANYVLYWEMIRDACLRGCRSFHLGRSTAHSGGEEFKSRWNAQQTQLYWYHYLPRCGPLPSLNVENKKYQLAIRAWRRMPLWCTRVIGPPLARRIP